jgi:molecular chaperone GrpE (heat shock protein)
MSPEYNNDQPPEPAESGAPNSAPEDSTGVWKDEMRRDFEAWLAAVEEIPDFEDRIEEEPDLYSFYEQLAILNTESRKSNRRAADALSQWGSTLERFKADLTLLHEKIGQTPDRDSGKGSLSRNHCLALIELLDRLLRLQEAFGAHAPKRSWLRSHDAAWRRAWHAQHEACGILIAHFEALLAVEGVERMDCLGNAFDPTMMAAAAVERDPARPANTVIEEIARGYRWRGELLRYAQVKVNALPQSSPL